MNAACPRLAHPVLHGVDHVRPGLAIADPHSCIFLQDDSFDVQKFFFLIVDFFFILNEVAGFLI
ncbi:MAG: hypothetical protein AAF035_09895, partial [Pseudomonadota bacterium]